MNILRTADIIAAEDTRHTGRLLKLLEIERTGKFISNHQYNTLDRIPAIIHAARNGASVAVISDAGTPGISDPGMELASACISEGINLIPIPGPCAAIAAFCVSGFLDKEWVFMGFIPSRRGSDRTQKLKNITAESRPVIIYEAPHRIIDTMNEFLTLSSNNRHRTIVCARELTKLHEEIYRGTVESAIKYFERKERGAVRGEFTVIFGPSVSADSLKDEEMLQIVKSKLRELMDGGMSSSSASKYVAKELDMKKSWVYDVAVRLNQE